MGRYMRKAKSGEVAVMELGNTQQHFTIGVRTRARTLALQRLQSGGGGGDSSSYLELRSRRLEKPMSLSKPKEAFKESPNASPRSKTSKAAAVRPSASAEVVAEEIEASFGENVLDFDAARDDRETTPCSLMMRDSETIGTPGSTTRCSNSSSTSRKVQSSTHLNIPTCHEMEEFFACAERLQQRIFTDKYNFDPVNDSPLPGRYEWVKVE